MSAAGAKTPGPHGEVRYSCTSTPSAGTWVRGFMNFTSRYNSKPYNSKKAFFLNKQKNKLINPANMVPK
jgi:hypothetical protein